MCVTTYVALLRGINILGRNRIKMTDLVEALEAIGLAEVRTYIQSGNVVFRSRSRRKDNLATRIRKAIATGHGFEPEVIVLTLDEIEKAMAANPFPEAEGEPKSIHLFFLDERPSSPDIAGLDAKRAGRERFALDGKVFYLHTPDGFGRSKLAAGAERLLGVPATARNWRTMTKIVELARGEG